MTSIPQTRRLAAIAVTFVAALVALAQCAVASAVPSWAAPVEIAAHTGPAGSWLPWWISCPSTTQCTEIDGLGGHEITFNPQNPGIPTPQAISAMNVTTLDCPSTSECVGFNTAASTVTFNPQAPSPSFRLVAHDRNGLGDATCPTATECVALDSTGDAVAFDPSKAGVTRSVLVAKPTQQPGFADVVCFSAVLCTVLDGRVLLTLNPTTGKTVLRATLASTDRLNAVTCVSSALCVASDSPPFTGPTSDVGGVMTFDPSTGATVAPRTIINQDRAFYAVTCPSASQCTATNYGEETTFNPADPAGTATTRQTNAGGFNNQGEIACPAVNQCSVIASDTHTFDPTDPSAPISVASFAVNGELGAVSCPTPTQCTAMPTSGQQVTFNPSDPAGTVTAFQVDPADTSSAAQAAGTSAIFGPVACPSAVLCVAGARVPVPPSGSSTTYSSVGAMVAFDPQQRSNPTVTDVPGFSPDLISCPTADQCTSVSDDGHEVTFDPSSPGTPTPQQIGTTFVNDVSCPTVTQCTGVGLAPTTLTPANAYYPGYEVTFNPQSPTDQHGAIIDTGFALLPSQHCYIGLCPDNAQIHQVSCPTADECVASDGLARLLTFDPQNPGTPSLRLGPGGTLSCPTADECLAVSNDIATELDPLASAAPSSTALTTAARPEGISCPTPDECILGDQDGHVIVGIGLAGPAQAPPPSATATSTAANGRTDTADVECYAAPTASCTVTVTVSVHETLAAGRVIAVIARRRRAMHRVLVFAHANATIIGGEGATLTLTLNPAGTKLLRERHTFTATLTAAVNGVTRMSTVRFGKPVPPRKPARRRHGRKPRTRRR